MGRMTPDELAAIGPHKPIRYVTGGHKLAPGAATHYCAKCREPWPCEVRTLTERLAEADQEVSSAYASRDKWKQKTIEARRELAERDAVISRVRAVWDQHRDGTMTWRLVRDMDAALAGGGQPESKPRDCPTCGHPNDEHDDECGYCDCDGVGQ